MQEMKADDRQNQDMPPFMPFTTAQFTYGCSSFAAPAPGEGTRDDCLLYDSQVR